MASAPASIGSSASCSTIKAIRSSSETATWECLFSNPSQWWDFRHSKRNPGHPDFRHKASNDALWLDSSQRPPWVPHRLASLENLTDPAPCASSIANEIHDLLRNGDLDKAMHFLTLMDQLNFTPSQGMYKSFLKACNKHRAVNHAKLIYSHISSRRLLHTSFLGDFTVVTLAKCGAMDAATELLYSLPKRSVYSWTAMISGYVDSGREQEALNMYSKMLDDDVEADTWTFVCIFKACGNLGNLNRGKELHDDAKVKGFSSDIFVASTLISMYGKCGDISEAERVFRGMQERDDVAWSGMLSAYVEDHQWEKALCLYRQMYHEGINLYTLTLVSAVQACCILVEDGGWKISDGPSVKEMAIDIVRALHADARKHRITTDSFVGSTLLNFYGKVGVVREAEMLCSDVLERDVVAWSAMLSAYAEQGQEEHALRIFRQMQLEGVNPNKLTFVFALQSCAALADKEEPIVIHGRSVKLMAFEIGEALHIDAERKAFAFDVLVGSMLVSMYGKCGAVVEAELAFDNVYERDVVSWTALLSAYVKEGLGDKALYLYEQLQKEHISLTDISLVSVLQACRDVGCIVIVRQLHFSSVSSWPEASQLFSNTLIHAYGTCASMVDAEAVFSGMIEPDVVSWSACIAGYSQEGNCAHCATMFEKMLFVGINPDGVTCLSLLSAFRHAGLVHDAINSFVSVTKNHSLVPSLKHFAVMIDLFGRVGNLKAVQAIFRKMPKGIDINILLGLLGSCRTHGNLELAKSAFNHAVQLQPMDATAYVLMSNLYADRGMFDKN